MKRDAVVFHHLLWSIIFSMLILVVGCSGGGGGETKTGAEAENNAERLSTSSDSGRTYREIVPQTAPLAADFELPRLEGGTFHLADYRGSIVLLDFWATWCAPCRMSIPHLIKVHEKFKNRNVVVVGIALDKTGAKVVENFADAFKIPYSILLGDTAIVAKYGNFPSIPVSFIIDEQGRIVERHTGFRPFVVYNASLEVLLRKTAEADSTAT